MEVTVELKEPFHYSFLPTLCLLGLFLVVLFLFFWSHRKKKEKKVAPTYFQRADISFIKQKYLQKIEQLSLLWKGEKITNRKAYQQLSKLVREFMAEVTGIPVQNYSLAEMEVINMPIAYELIKEYYQPEFAQISRGNIETSMEKAKKVIYEWN